MKDDPFDDLENLRLPPGTEARIGTPAKIQKRRKDFIMVPVAWDDRLTGCTGHTYKIANRVLYLHWKNRGRPFRLANGMLKYDGVSRYAKWRALARLEQLGLISIKRGSGKSPNIRPLGTQKDVAILRQVACCRFAAGFPPTCCNLAADGVLLSMSLFLVSNNIRTLHECCSSPHTLTGRRSLPAESHIPGRRPLSVQR